MKRPLVVLTIGYIIGIIWGLYFNFSIALLYAIMLIVYFIFKIFYKPKRKFKLISFKRYFRYVKLVLNVNILILIIISSIVSNIILKIVNNKYENFYQTAVSQTQFEGIVVDNGKSKEYKTVYEVQLETGEKLLINVKNSTNSSFEYGDKIQFTGTYSEPDEARNYKGFNYKEYLKTKQIYGTVNVNSIKKISSNSINPIFSFFNNLFLKIKETVKQVFNEELGNLFLGIMLGYTDEIDQDIKESFQQNNISYILAVSGMHISYIILGITYLLEKTAGKRKTRIIICFILAIYAGISGFSPSVVRASLMGILLMGAGIFHRKNDIWTSIAISLLIILINNPYSIKSVGVLLSYGGTIGIIVFNKNVLKMLNSIKIKKYKSRKFKILEKPIKIIKEIFSVTISAQLMIIPVMAVCFGTLNITSIIANVLVGLIIGPIVIVCFIGIVISFVSVKAFGIMAVLISVGLQFLLEISKLCNLLPLNKVYICTPNMVEICAYYATLFVLNSVCLAKTTKQVTPSVVRAKNLIALFKYKYRENKVKIKKVILCFMVLLVIVNFIPKGLKVYFIDVGQGDSTLIKTPMNNTILIDGGGSINSEFDVGKNTLIPYLLARNVNQLDYIMISHYDYDHVGGILTVLSELKVKNVIIAKQYESTSQFEEFKKLVEEKNINVIVVKAGQRVNIEKNIYFKILHPTDNEITENKINNNALVAKFVYNKFSILFTGDIEEIAEKEILKRYKGTNELQANVLKVAHHGSKTSSTQEFLEAVQPQIALIGVGKNNSYGHPNEDVINRLENLRSKNKKNRFRGGNRIIKLKLYIKCKLKKFIK